MADVLAFPRIDEDRVIWRCNCGCISFELRGDGGAACVQCGSLVDGADGDWRAQLPDVPVTPKEMDTDSVKVTDLNGSPQALARALSKANVDETSAVLILQNDGAVTVWGAIETDEQSEWFDRRVAVAKDMLTKKG